MNVTFEDPMTQFAALIDFIQTNPIRDYYTEIILTWLLCSFFMLSTCLKLFLDSYMPTVFDPIMIVVGICLGKIIVFMDWISNNKELSETFVGSKAAVLVVTLISPLMTFHTTLSIDYHTLGRALGTIASVSVPAFCVHGIVMTTLISPIMELSYDWNWSTTFTLAMITAPVRVFHTDQNLSRAQGQVRQLQLLLKGEKLIALTLSLCYISLMHAYYEHLYRPDIGEFYLEKADGFISRQYQDNSGTIGNCGRSRFWHTCRGGWEVLINIPVLKRSSSSPLFFVFLLELLYSQLHVLNLYIQGTFSYMCAKISLNLNQFVIVVSRFLGLYSCWLLLSMPIGAIVAGILLTPLKYSYRDSIAQTALLVSGLYLTFLVTEVIGACGSLAVVTMGVVVNSSEIKFSRKCEAFMHSFWIVVSYVYSAMAFLLAGVILGVEAHWSYIEDLAYVTIIYVVITLARYSFAGPFWLPCVVAAKRPNTVDNHYQYRAATFFLVSPILRTSVSGAPVMPWRHIIIAITGVYRSAPTVILALLSSYYDLQHRHQTLIYACCIVCASSFFNVMLQPSLFNILGMFDLSRTRIVNMNTIVSQVNECRDKGIFSLKMDRVIADANWLIVEKLTKMEHPYKNKFTRNRLGELDLAEDSVQRTVICSECGGESIAPPTKKELIDITLEAKHRILKAQLVSFWSQHEIGTLSRRGVLVLANLAESAVVKEDPVLDSADLKIQREGSRTLFRLKILFGYLFTVTSKTHRFIPTNWFRAFFFRICTSRTFQIAMATCSLIDLSILLDAILHYHFVEHTTLFCNEKYFIEALNVVFYFLFTFEFWMQICGIGVVQYFVSHVNKFEFVASILVRSSERAMFVNSCIARHKILCVYECEPIIIHLKILLLFRVTRIYIFIVALIPKVLNMVDRKMDDDLIKSFDIGKAYIISLNRVMKFLGHIVDNPMVYNDIRTCLENHRLIVSKELGLIQKDRPTIAVTLKTKHAIIHVINNMTDCINDMKEEGILDIIENRSLMMSLDKVKMRLQDLLLVNPCSPDRILRHVPWLCDDASTIELFLEHARLSCYDRGEIIIYDNTPPEGIHVIVTGLVKAFYVPSLEALKRRRQFGMLPNYDFYTNLNFEDPQEEYVVGGNICGEVGAVTGRSYDMMLVCETAVQVFYIPQNIVANAVLSNSKNAPVVRARIWKSIGVKIAHHILKFVPRFQGWVKERLLLYLQRALIPILDGVDSININEYIEDVILIEGVVMDTATRATYYAPIYIPRTVTKLILTNNSMWGFRGTPIYTVIMIIPSTHAEQDDLLDSEGIFKDNYAEYHGINVEEVQEDSEEGKCSVAHKSIASNAFKLIQAQRRRVRSAAFMDYTPHISGPIEGNPVVSHFVFKNTGKNSIKTSPHPRTHRDGSINYVQDIEEESENNSMKDDEEEAQKKKKRSRRTTSRKKKRRQTSSSSLDVRESGVSMAGIMGRGPPAPGDADQKPVEIQIIESDSALVEDPNTKEVQTQLRMKELIAVEDNDSDEEEDIYEHRMSRLKSFVDVGGVKLDTLESFRRGSSQAND